MRWDDLFADLEAQVDALATGERAAEVEERARAEIGRVTLVDRLRPHTGARITVGCTGVLTITGVLRRVGPDWLLVDEGSGREAVLPLLSVLTVAGPGRLSAPPGSLGVVDSRLGLRSALRAVARDRSAVRVHLSEAAAGVLDGTLDRVGADFCELATHAPGELRRRGDVRGVVTIPFTALAALRRDAG